MGTPTGSTAARRPRSKVNEPFAEFYAAYLLQHRHPLNRALHLLAKLAMAAALVTAWLRGSLVLVAAVPFLGVLPCWLGHLIEGTRPTVRSRPSASLLGFLAAVVRGRRDRAQGRPYYSLLADFKMCGEMVRAAFSPASAHDAT